MLIMMPVGHSIVMLLREVESLKLWALINIAIGFFGVVVIHFGNKTNETSASIFGFMGAHLIFIGFFEFAFAFIANVLEIKPILHPENKEVLLSSSIQVVELSGLILLPLILLYSVNREVRCNMMVWIRRQLSMNITMVSHSKQRSFASITANETLFVIWTIYVISLVCLDPRVLGPTHWASMCIYSVFMIWPFYLIYRVRRFTSSGYIFRYSVPIGVLLWSWVEMLSSMNIIVEYFLYPLQYPLATALTAITAVTLCVIAVNVEEKERTRA